jgi:hypothetical protein
MPYIVAYQTVLLNSTMPYILAYQTIFTHKSTQLKKQVKSIKNMWQFMRSRKIEGKVCP